MNEFPEPQLDELRKVLGRHEYLYKTARYVSIRRRGKGANKRLYTIYLDGTVVCDGPLQTKTGWPVQWGAVKELCDHKFPSLNEALAFAQTGLVLKLYGDGVPDFFRRR